MSCSSFNVREIPHDVLNDPSKRQDLNGIIFYKPKPYLFVAKAKDSLTAQIIWLPDYCRAYIVQKNWYSLGDLDIAIKLNDGWNLTEFGAKETSGVSKSIDSITGLLGKVMKTGEQTAAGGGIFANLNEPGIYKLEFVQGQFNGLTPITKTEGKGSDNSKCQ